MVALRKRANRDRAKLNYMTLQKTKRARIPEITLPMFDLVLRIWDVLSRIPTTSHPGSGSKHFFITDPEYYMNSGMLTHFFLASYGFRSKVLVFQSQKNPGSGKNSSRIQGKKAPDSRTGSASLAY
jgi:hypothetical protein